MCKKIFLLTILAASFCQALLTVGAAFAGSIIIRAEAEPEIAPGFVQVGEDFTIDIYMQNTSGRNCLGYSATWQLYSPDDITNIAYRNIGGQAGLGSDGSILLLNGFGPLQYWASLNKLLLSSWDGNLPDTFNHSCAGVPPASAWPAGDNQNLIRIQIGVNSTQTGTLCIDSIGHPNPDFNWLWLPPSVPEFNGPYCWTISDGVPGAGSIIISAKAEPEIAPGFVQVGEDFTIDIYMKNTSSRNCLGYSATWRLYSPDDITNITYRDIGGQAGLGSDGSILLLNGFGPLQYWASLNKLLLSSWDGNLPDTFNHSCAGVPPASAWPAGDNQNLIRIQIGVNSTQTGTLCIDSIGHPNPDFNWLWLPPSVPEFNGPYCWTISDGVPGAGNIIIRAEAEPEIAPGFVQVGEDFTIDIYMQNTSGRNCLGYSATWQLYSPDDITNITYRDIGGQAGLGSDGSVLLLNGFGLFQYWTTLNQLLLSNWDGSLPDTFNHSCAGVPPASSWPGADNQDLIRIQIGVNSTQTGTLCIDSIGHPNPDYNWLWLPPSIPEFDGPYCWVICDGAPPSIGLGADSLAFSGFVGGAPPPAQYLVVSAVGAGTLNWTGSWKSSWLNLSPSFGAATSIPSNIQVSVDITGLSAGVYLDTIVISAPAPNSPQIAVVSLTLTNPPPTIGLSPAQFYFSALAGSDNPADQILHVVNAGSGTLNWSATNSESWLNINPTSGVDDDEITLSVNITGLPHDIYYDTIIVSDPAATNNPLFAAVQLEVALDTPCVTLRVHNVGNIGLSVANNGQFGTGFMGIPAIDPMTGLPAPSCKYPLVSTDEYLFGGTLWVGAIVDEDTLVSVGFDGWQIVKEMHPDICPIGDFIYRSINGPGSNEAISEQDYVASYFDTLTDPIFVQTDPRDNRPHIPLNLDITQKSYSWSNPEIDDFIIMEYDIENIGTNNLEKAYIGFYVDADVIAGGEDRSVGAQDDICGFLQTAPSPTAPPECGFEDDVNIAWIADNDGRLGNQSGCPDDFALRHVTGFRFLSLPLAYPNINFNWWISNGNTSLDWGPRLAGSPEDPFRDFGGMLGTPEGDRNKYYIMSHPEVDYDQLFAGVDHSSDGWLPPTAVSQDVAGGWDTRYLLSFGPFDLAPGQTIPIYMAYVGGADFHISCQAFETLFDPSNPQAYYNQLNFDNLVANATAAYRLFDIPGYDTDGDAYRGRFRICDEDTFWYEGDGVPDFLPQGLQYDTKLRFRPEPQMALYANAFPGIMDTIFLGHLVSFDYDAVDPASVMINGTIPASSVTVLASHPDYVGKVLRVVFPARSFIQSYGNLYGESLQNYTLSGDLSTSQGFSFEGDVSFIGHLLGDVNGDEKANLLDILYLIDYIYADGPEPLPSLVYGDINQDGEINLLDILMQIEIIY